MADIGPSRLQGAFINYLNFNDFNRGNISGDVEKDEMRTFILKINFSLYVVSLLVTVLIIILLSKEDDFVFNCGYAVVVWICLGLLLFSKYIPLKHMHNLGKMLCCPWSCCRSFPTEDQGVQTNENMVDQHQQDDIEQDDAEEQTLHQPTTLREATDEQILLQSDEIGGQTDASLITESLPSKRWFHLRRIFGCPCSYGSGDTQTLEIQTADNAPCQLAAPNDETAEQDSYQTYQTEQQTTFQPEGLCVEWEENYASATLIEAEKRLLQYFLHNDGAEESSSNQDIEELNRLFNL